MPYGNFLYLNSPFACVRSKEYLLIWIWCHMLMCLRQVKFCKPLPTCQFESHGLGLDDDQPSGVYDLHMSNF